MKNLLTLSAALIGSLTISAQALPPSPYEAQIEALLSKMTLEQKVGQTAQYTLNTIGQGKSIYESNEPFTLDEVRIEEMFGKLKVGSILNTSNNRALSVEHWRQIIDGIQSANAKYSDIPVLYGVDAVHGVTYTAGATMFPQQISMGATFNRNLVREGAKVTAYEMRACNIPWNFAPVLDVGRDARWARMWETYGEDVYLISELGVACVKGFQGDAINKLGRDNVAACLKHFTGYGAPFSGKDRTPAYIPINDMIEKHFAQYKAAIEAGALSVMVNSGMINGISTHNDKNLLTVMLKEGLKYDGVLVTDWQDVNNLYRRDKIAATDKEAIKLAFNAGIDMAMVPYDKSYCRNFIELVNEGQVPMSRLDDAVRRILRLKFRVGLFDKTPMAAYPEFGSKKFEALAQLSADESVTLLKNKDNILPLKKGTKILVAGPNAASMRTLNGGWTYSWQGEKVEEFAADYNNILEAMSQEFGTQNVNYCAGVEYNMTGKYYEELAPDFDAAVKAASGVDVVVVCVGENSYTEKPGDLDDLYLSDNQQELVKRLAATGKPVVLVLNEGRPRVISKIEPVTAAVIQTYLPGNMGGNALAGVLSGRVNPSGKLPYTYPKYPNALLTYDYKPSENQEKMAGVYDYQSVTSVQYAFGFGLSYTTFEYSNLTVNKSTFTADDTLVFTVDVCNSGTLTGKESVLLFTSDLVASMTPDNRRLRGFEKIELKAGETKQVKIEVPARALAFVDDKGNWLLERGDFKVQVGNQTLSIAATQNATWR